MAVVHYTEKFGTAGDTVLVTVGTTSTPASLFSDAAGMLVLANPVTVTGNGTVSFYAAPGTYVLTETGTGTDKRTITLSEDTPSLLTEETTRAEAAESLKQDAATAATDTELTAALATAAADATTKANAAQTAAQIHADSGDATHSAANPAHTAGAVSVTTSGLAVVTHTNVQAALADLDTWANGRPTHESGTLSALPANGSRNNGSTYLATDQNGGTTYRMVSGVWAQEAAGVNSVLGLVAGPIFLTTSFNIVTVGAVATDIPGMSIAVPASSHPVCVRFACEVNGNGSGASASAAANTKLSAYVLLTDTSNALKALAPASFISTGVNGAPNEFRQIAIEFWLDAPVSAATYKLRAQSSAAIPSNWAILSVVPSTGQVSGARAGLTATAY